MLTIPNIKEAKNLDLAGVALDCLCELELRGNKSWSANCDLDRAIKAVTLFYNNISILQQEIILEPKDEHLRLK